MIIELPFQFNPRPAQLEFNRAFFAEGYKRLIQVMHRRGGKSKNGVNFILGAALQRVGSYFHLFPEYKQAKNVIWRGIDKEGKRYLDHIPRALIKSKNNTEMRIDLINGSQIILAGSDHYNGLMGTNPAGIIFDEYPLQNPLAWHYLRPILAQNGGWAAFFYTPRGKNHGYELFHNGLKNDKWFVQLKTANDNQDWNGNKIITDDMIAEEREAGMPEELIQQEFFCSFDAAVVGAYYSKELALAHEEGRIFNFDIKTDLSVYTFWDIGISDSTSIWFLQPDGNALKMVHYYENNGFGAEHYANYCLEWARKNNVKFARHYAPFDIDNTDWVTARTRREICRKLGINFEIAQDGTNAVKRLPIIEGITAARNIFYRVYFHKTNCEFGLRCLSEYHRRHILNEHGVEYKDQPNHNWASHGADAFRYFAIVWQDLFTKPVNTRLRVIHDWNPLEI